MESQKSKPKREALLRKQFVMGNITIKGGTPRASDALCRTCTHSHILKGFSATEELFFWEQFYPKRPLPFLVCECTLYEDKHRATLEPWNKSPGSSPRGSRAAALVSSAPRDSMRYKRSRTPHQ
jgi:hypothetical protein